MWKHNIVQRQVFCSHHHNVFKAARRPKIWSTRVCSSSFVVRAKTTTTMTTNTRFFGDPTSNLVPIDCGDHHRLSALVRVAPIVSLRRGGVARVGRTDGGSYLGIVWLWIPPPPFALRFVGVRTQANNPYFGALTISAPGAVKSSDLLRLLDIFCWNRPLQGTTIASSPSLRSDANERVHPRCRRRRGERCRARAVFALGTSTVRVASAVRRARAFSCYRTGRYEDVRGITPPVTVPEGGKARWKRWSLVRLSLMRSLCCEVSNGKTRCTDASVRANGSPTSENTSIWTNKQKWCRNRHGHALARFQSCLFSADRAVFQSWLGGDLSKRTLQVVLCTLRSPTLMSFIVSCCCTSSSRKVYSRL